MKAFKAFIALCLLGVFICASIFFWGQSQFYKPGTLSQSVIVDIPSGSSVRSIAEHLKSKNIIAHPLVFIAASKLLKTQNKLQAGEYEFTPKISAYEAMNLLVSGKTYLHSITFPEGITSHEIIESLKTNTLLQGDIKGVFPDGLFLPETYHFAKGEYRGQLIKKMITARNEALDHLWETRAKDLPIKSKQQAVTLASIVEKETGVGLERAKVAGVFLNRLRKNMPLQTDPTVIYALTEGKGKLDRPLYRKDLKVDHPYNTYMNAGLPPGPICNPGLDSLKAVLNPETHDYLYFVADGTGGHAFAKTLTQHNRNVAAWRKIKKNRAN